MTIGFNPCMFIDTNALIYSRNLKTPFHLPTREIIQRAADEQEPLRISRQIIREYLAAVTRPQNWLVPITREQALLDAESFLQTFEILEDGPQVTNTLIQLCRETPVGGRQIHDANIVATMLAHGESQLLTFNTADFQRFTNHIQIINS